MANLSRLNEIVAPAVEAAGYEFVGLEYKLAGKHSVLCVYIDNEAGINVDDCASCSRQISAIMDVEDPITSEYSLEVSSPGVERPLFTSAHFQQFKGENVKIKLHSGVNGKRNFHGKINAVNNNSIQIEVDGEIINFDIGQLHRANIIPNW